MMEPEFQEIILTKRFGDAPPKKDGKRARSFRATSRHLKSDWKHAAYVDGRLVHVAGWRDENTFDERLVLDGVVTQFTSVFSLFSKLKESGELVPPPFEFDWEKAAQLVKAHDEAQKIYNESADAVSKFFLPKLHEAIARDKEMALQIFKSIPSDSVTRVFAMDALRQAGVQFKK